MNVVPAWTTPAIGVALGVLLFWLILLVVLWVQQRRLGDSVDWREAARLVPDTVRLIRRLAADHSQPRRVRWTLWLLLGYLLLPIDLVPDFIPVLGYADDAIIVALALRFMVRNAGFATLQRHWPGTPAGLESLLALARVQPPRSDN